MANIISIVAGRLFGLGKLQNNYYTTQQIGTTVPEWVDTTHKWTLYKELPELQSVVNRYAKMVASANPIVKDKDGNIIEKGHWIFDLIDRPNPMQSWGNMMYMTAINKAVTNNALLYAPKMTLGSRQLLLPLAFNNVQIIPTGKQLRQTDISGFIKEFKIPKDATGAYDTFTPDEVIYFAEPDGINLFNTVSKIDALKYPLSNIALQYRKRNVLLKNLFALGILSMENSDGMSAIPLDQKEKEEMRKDLMERNNGMPVITDKQAKWDAMSFPTKDLMLYEELGADMLAVIDAFGLNQHMFGSNSESRGSTFSNVEAGEKQAYNATVIPDTEIIYDEITKQLKLDKEGLYLYPSFEHISSLQNDMNKSAQALLSRSQALEKIALQLTLTDDEKRALLGM
jgi:phage portal protein BeeE